MGVDKAEVEISHHQGGGIEKWFSFVWMSLLRVHRSPMTNRAIAPFFNTYQNLTGRVG